MEEAVFCDRCGRIIEEYDEINFECESCYQTICSFCFGTEKPDICMDCERYGDE